MPDNNRLAEAYLEGIRRAEEQREIERVDNRSAWQQVIENDELVYEQPIATALENFRHYLDRGTTPMPEEGQQLTRDLFQEAMRQMPRTYGRRNLLESGECGRREPVREVAMRVFQRLEIPTWFPGGVVGAKSPYSLPPQKKLKWKQIGMELARRPFLHSLGPARTQRDVDRKVYDLVADLVRRNIDRKAAALGLRDLKATTGYVGESLEDGWIISIEIGHYFKKPTVRRIRFR